MPFTAPLSQDPAPSKASSVGFGLEDDQRTATREVSPSTASALRLLSGPSSKPKAKLINVKKSCVLSGLAATVTVGLVGTAGSAIGGFGLVASPLGLFSGEPIKMSASKSLAELEPECFYQVGSDDRSRFCWTPPSVEEGFVTVVPMEEDSVKAMLDNFGKEWGDAHCANYPAGEKLVGKLAEDVTMLRKIYDEIESRCAQLDRDMNQETGRLQWIQRQGRYDGKLEDLNGCLQRIENIGHEKAEELELKIEVAGFSEQALLWIGRIHITIVDDAPNKDHDNRVSSNKYFNIFILVSI